MRRGSSHDDDDDDDDRKAFLSRVPTRLDDVALLALLRREFGDDAVVDARTARSKEADDDDDDGGGDRPRTTDADADAPPSHRGFAFVTFSSADARRVAVERATVRWDENDDANEHGDDARKTRPRKRKRRTMYLAPVDRTTSGGRSSETDADAVGATTAAAATGVCFLWRAGRCTRGDACRFAHEGEGRCVPATTELSCKERRKKKTCFSFRKTGACKRGDDCPFSHDVAVVRTSEPNKTGDDADAPTSSLDFVVVVDKKDKDCINWRTKGKCRKGDACPYRHDPRVRDEALRKQEAKKKKKNKWNDETAKPRRPLRIRVFGLNYDTTEDRVREFLADCGPIVEMEFPTFDDSGRSKGYCGVLFQSPKAVDKAVALDGAELDGRWLRIQPGKMYLKQWEAHHHNSNQQHNDDDKERSNDDDGDEAAKEMPLGEYGQKVKRRKRHGFRE